MTQIKYLQIADLNIAHRIRRVLIAVSLLLGLVAATTAYATEAGASDSGPSVLGDAWQTLTKGNYKQKADAIQAIAKQNPPQTVAVLKAMLQGELYYAKKTKRLYHMSEGDGQYRFSSIFDDEVVMQNRKRGYRKVKINNNLRGLLRQSLAGLQLGNKDAKVRLAAVNELLKSPDDDALQIVRSRIANEADEGVKHAMAALLAIDTLLKGDIKDHSEAIATLRDSLSPAAINALRSYHSPEKQLEAEAQQAIKSIDARKSWYSIIETTFFGLSLGSVLALAAIGLAITFGVMGVINMAHGELMMIGAYTTFVVQTLMPEHIGLSILVAIPAAFVVAGSVGIAIERGIIRHLYGRPLETLLATFGVSLILQQAVRSIFSPLNRTVETPQWMSGAWQVNEVLALTWNRMYIILFCLAVFMALIAIMKRTSLGLQVRAVSQNRNMARAMGVRSDWVDALTFGLGAGIAGIAGVGLSLLTNVGPNLGQSYIIDSFMVVVFGGVGNLLGTLVAGLGLGVANKIMEPWAGAVLAKILVLIFIILFIQKRPRGLFPQRGRAAEG